ncbi:MAG: hypothetical protein HYZ51_01030 [Candidatus Doudnabacteria bacterium]|nr:hypothetical protein [Candidatus Doudnabacteria bacterium]
MSKKTLFAFLGALVLGFNLPSLASAQALNSAVGRVSESIVVGKTISVDLGNGVWRLDYNNSPQTLFASISGNILTVSGLNPGLGTAYGCNQNKNCFALTVSVTSGKVLGASTVQTHPVGSWVINGSRTIYYVHAHGLIPVPSMRIFLQNGGLLGKVVKLSIYDEQLPLLPIMELNDYRLK